MKTSALRVGDELVLVSRLARRHRISAGFTLVEMLVVITIIGMLAALVVPAVVAAKNSAKRATITMEIKQLEMACQAYKEKFGEYPPDFSDVISTAGQQTILRHLAKAFPRYQPGVGATATGHSPLPLTGFQGFLADVKDGWGLNVIDATASPVTIDPKALLTPSTALAFWLGGCPQWNGAYPPTGTLAARPVTSFGGFAADPTNPFNTVALCPSRTPAFYDFNLTCLYFVEGVRTSAGVVTTSGGFWAWPSSACTNTSAPYCPFVYFRAENGNYTTDGATLAAAMTNAKYVTVPLTAASTVNVWPAIDRRLSNPTSTPPQYTWVNPSSIQIFSAGLNVRYAAPFADAVCYPGVTGNVGPYEFPTGVNYNPDTNDDIANFSNGTLEDNMNKP